MSWQVMSVCIVTPCYCNSCFVDNVLMVLVRCCLLGQALYCVAGKCYDTLDHRSRALRAFTTALRIDPSCTEVAEHMTRRGMLSQQEVRAALCRSLAAARQCCVLCMPPHVVSSCLTEWRWGVCAALSCLLQKLDLLQRVVVLDGHPGKEWLQPYYRCRSADQRALCRTSHSLRCLPPSTPSCDCAIIYLLFYVWNSFTLGSEAPECLDLVCTDEQGLPDASHEVSALSLAMQAAFLYKHGFMEDAFRVAGQVETVRVAAMHLPVALTS